MVNRDICKILCPIPLSSLSAGQDLEFCIAIFLKDFPYAKCVNVKDN